MTCRESLEKKLRKASWGAVAALFGSTSKWERIALNFGSKIRAPLGR